MEGGDSDKKDKMILVTYRLKDNPDFRPAEEIFVKVVIEKLQIEYEKIEYQAEIGSRYQLAYRLPILYSNGALIRSHEIFNFFINLLIENPSRDFTIITDELQSLLHNKFRLVNEFYLEKKTEEKKGESKIVKAVKKLIDYCFSSRTSYKSVIEETISRVTNESVSESAGWDFHFTSFFRSTVEHMLVYIDHLKSFSTGQEKFLAELLVYSFVEEEIKMFSKVRRPLFDKLVYEEDKAITNLREFHRIAQKTLTADTQIQMVKDLKQLEKIFTITFNPKKKDKENVQTFIENQVSLKQTLLAVSTFLGVSLFFYWLSHRKK